MIDWRDSALEDLLALDRFRKRRDLPPIRWALFLTIRSYFAGYQQGQPVPGKRFTLPAYPDQDLRLARVTVGRHGGPYRVVFRYDRQEQGFEILRVLHPRQRGFRG